MKSNKKRKPIRRKKAFKRRLRIVRNRIILAIIIIILLILGIEKFVNLDEVIQINEIIYYIDIADNNSKNMKQLNWKEIAAIDSALNDDEYCNSDEESVNKIASYFYTENDTVKSFNEVINSKEFTKKQRKLARRKLKYLQEVSIRYEYEGINEEKDNFINKLSNGAIKCYKEYGVLPSIVIAQAILESDWGQSELASKYNNFYGIKADPSWKGEVANFTTNENYNDVIKANFRAYNTIEESIYDLGKFLNENSRYRENGFFDSGNYIEQANALENAGYSTVKNKNGEPIYADLLIELIRENNLMIFDTMI